jgi:Putative peptidoglycan binding domain
VSVRRHAAAALILIAAVLVVAPAAARPRPAAQAQSGAPAAGPFLGNGMWIWQLGRSNGGDPSAIAARALAHGVNTVFIKSSDGRSWWPQFSPALVSTLKAAGLRVCAWQYVYGLAPYAEANLGIHAAQVGADCLVIDAEKEYEGRYAQADAYVRTLRAAVGPGYPIGLAGFPYVDYHPAFPYSVFLGPDGAQFNVPQMYWRAIGTTVDRVYSHTMAWNLPYGKPVFPLGQLWENPSPREITRFRQLAAAYGASGVSWWDWQEASARGWRAVGATIASPATAGPLGYPRLRRGARGDLVLLAQERLRAAGVAVPLSGVLGAGTQSALRAFQASNGVPATGVLDTATWRALPYYPLPRVRWAHGHAVSAAAAGVRNGPASAWLGDVRDELPPKPHGAG